ncbi:MAG: Xaa-Pro peptidase family protein [Planctomycetota bacterium]|nr:Xaa-Pro peptidase family protein [Planctomycetota bacterium]
MTTEFENALAKLTNQSDAVAPIQVGEFQERIQKCQSLMQQNDIDAIYLHAGTNLFYFTGLQWNPSERMVAAVLPAEGKPCYIAPRFELDTLKDYWQIECEIYAWDEHENPYQRVSELLHSQSIGRDKIAIDETAPFFIADGLKSALPKTNWICARSLTETCRQQKSPNEIAIIRQAHNMTMKVIEAAASILKPGISTCEVTKFIDDAHRTVGASNGSYFCIVLFGVATSFPHGVKNPQILDQNDWVLIDTGFLLHGYNSDITRTFPMGNPTSRQAEVWDLEREAQLAAFEAAKPGNPCEAVDAAARKTLEAAGLGPDYQVPGLPHRTGHGCGLDIHEAPYMVRGNSTSLEPGMVASIEPMIVLPGEFGVRLEDHFYITDNGAEWFTEPARSMTDLF